jgi:hypothetical protein
VPIAEILEVIPDLTADKFGRLNGDSRILVAILDNPSKNMVEKGVHQKRFKK